MTEGKKKQVPDLKVHNEKWQPKSTQYKNKEINCDNFYTSL